MSTSLWPEPDEDVHVLRLCEAYADSTDRLRALERAERTGLIRRESDELADD